MSNTNPGGVSIRSFAKNVVQLQNNAFLNSWCLSLFQDDSKSTKTCEENEESIESDDSQSSQVSLPIESQNTESTDDLDVSKQEQAVEGQQMEMKEKIASETEFPTIESEKDNPLEDTQVKELPLKPSGPIQQSIMKHVVLVDDSQKNTTLQIVHSTKKRAQQKTIDGLFASQKTNLPADVPLPPANLEQIATIDSNPSSSSSSSSQQIANTICSTLPEITCSPSDATYDSAAVILTQIEIPPPQNETPDRNETEITSQNSITEENSNSSVAPTALSNPTISPPVITVADVQPVVPQSSSPCTGKLRLPSKKRTPRKSNSKRKKETSEPEEKSARQKMLEKLKEKNVSPEEIENLFHVAGFHIPKDMNAEEAEKQKRIHQKKLDQQLNRELEHPLMKPAYVNQHYNLAKLIKYVEETKAFGTHNPYYGISPFNHVLKDKFPETVLIFQDYQLKIITRHLDEHVTWAMEKRIPWKTMLRGSKDMQSHVLQYIRFCYEMSGEAPVLDIFICEIRLTLFINCMEKFGKRYNTVANHAKSLETVR